MKHLSMKISKYHEYREKKKLNLERKIYEQKKCAT